MTRTIEIDQTITVSSLAQELELPATNLISKLVKNGLMITLNERIDFDTVAILIDELGLDVEIKPKQIVKTEIVKRSNVINKSRSPVVAVMGHVNHGKTSLLDKIRGSNQVSIEAGSITQHISAMQVVHNDRSITFLDTPGHEAFTAIREHGVILTDLIILVVAADDGIKDQTLEAIRFAKKTGVKIIVAANKIDKDAANLNLLKQQLAEHGLQTEDFGGQTVFVPVSAKSGQGIDKLMDMILLVADIEDLQADSQGQATGIVIESAMKKGLGPVATVLVQEGVLTVGDYIVAGDTWGKIRLMHNTAFEEIAEAGPSTPVTISGLKDLPEFGINFKVVQSEKEAKNSTRIFRQDNSLQSFGMSSSELLRIIDRRTGISEYKVIVKADVQGSLTSAVNSIKTLDTDEVVTRVVNSNVGVITENDITSAKISQATIYCFNLNIPVSIRRLAAQNGVDIRTYSVIYELLEDVKSALEKLLDPIVETIQLGKLQIKGVFKTTRTEIICGGKVTKGKLSLPARVRIIRDKQQLTDDIELKSLAKSSSAVSEIPEGEMCGVRLATQKKIVLKEDDILEFYRLDTKERKL